VKALPPKSLVFTPSETALNNPFSIIRAISDKVESTGESLIWHESNGSNRDNCSRMTMVNSRSAEMDWKLFYHSCKIYTLNKRKEHLIRLGVLSFWILSAVNSEISFYRIQFFVSRVPLPLRIV
jgi:hypothetical protein